MENHAQELVYRLIALMPSVHMKASLQCLLALFLEHQRPRASAGKTKSESALSRFLNRYGWPTGKVIKTTRWTLKRLIQSYLKVHRGRLPIVYAVVDWTCLEKTGKYKGLETLVRTYNGEYGVHVALLYVSIGPWRFPWSFRVYRGKDTPIPTQLALKLLRQMPNEWRARFKIRVLADAGFSTTALIPGAQALGFDVLMSVRCDRCLEGRQCVSDLSGRGQRVQLKGLETRVSLSWFWRKHEPTGQRDQHFVVATEPLSGTYIVRLGKRRWAIEACFKTLKHQFDWDCFGQGTPLGMYRWWILSLIAYLLAHWHFLDSEQTTLDWQQAAQEARDALFPQEVVAYFLQESKRIQPILAKLGISVNIGRVPVAA